MLSAKIRTPLHSIRFNAVELGKRPELQELEEVQMLLRDSSHLVDLTDDVLDLTKMESSSDVDAPEVSKPIRSISLKSHRCLVITGAR